MMIKKPMLAARCHDTSLLKYPVWCTPKFDGIRALTVNGLVSRTFKPIRNTYVRNKVEAVLGDGFDGELVVDDGRPCGAAFTDTTSAIMREAGEPKFLYHLFDYVIDPERGYLDRAQDLADEPIWDTPFLRYVWPIRVNDEDELLKYEVKYLTDGFEGIIIRSENGPYKFGRSTLKEGYLLKLKRFTDGEAIVIGFEEQMHNENEAEKDAFGRTKRSQAQAGKVAAGTLGKLYVSNDQFGEFEIGTGFSADQRDEIWDYQTNYMGAIVKYKYQAVGVVEKPRFPVFLGWRDPDDM